LKGKFSASPDRNATLLKPASAQRALAFSSIAGVEAGDRTCLRRECGGDDAWSAGDVEQSAPAYLAERSAEATGIVGLRGPTIEIRRLTSELARDALEMIHAAPFVFSDQYGLAAKGGIDEDADADAGPGQHDPDRDISSTVRRMSRLATWVRPTPSPINSMSVTTPDTMRACGNAGLMCSKSWVTSTRPTTACG
jgi:hypothetical protein